MNKAPILAKPEHGDILTLCLSVSKTAVSSVFIKEVDKVEHPMYYTSKSMTDPGTRYLDIEKVALALICSAQKLHPYFEAPSMLF